MLLSPWLFVHSTVYAMVKQRKRSKRKQTSSSTTSNSSSSSGRSSSSSSSSSTTSSVEPDRPSKVRESKTAALTAFRLQDKTSALIQKPQFDPTDGAIVYSTMDAACFSKQQAIKALSAQWNKPYCCHKPFCKLCLDHKRTSRAELMLDVIKVLPGYSTRSNKKKFHQIVDRVLRSI